MSGRAGATACVLLALAAGACGDGTRAPAAESLLDPSPKQKHYGMTYAEWAVTYMKWQFETASSVLSDIKACTAGQLAESPVVFLDEELAARTEPRPCTFGPEQALFFPLLSLTSLAPFHNYYTDSAMAAKQPGVGAAAISPAALKASVAEVMQRLVIEDASVSVDGRAVQDPLSGRVEPTQYSYHPYPGDNALFRLYAVADVPPNVDPAFVSGYWLLLAPLGRGRHELSISVRGHTSGTNIQRIREEFTYQAILD